MTLTDDQATALAADAQQAAYFRRTLLAEREQILDTVIKRQALAGRGLDAGRAAGSQARRAEAEIRYIERLIDGLDRRFAGHWNREG